MLDTTNLVKDNPEGMYEGALNLFYAKDGEVWVRGFGKDGGDVTLYDFARAIIVRHDFDICQDQTDEELGCLLCECLADGIDTLDGCLALLYQAGWVCADLRARLQKWENGELSRPGFKQRMIGRFQAWQRNVK